MILFLFLHIIDFYIMIDLKKYILEKLVIDTTIKKENELEYIDNIFKDIENLLSDCNYLTPKEKQSSIPKRVSDFKISINCRELITDSKWCIVEQDIRHKLDKLKDTTLKNHKVKIDFDDFDSVLTVTIKPLNDIDTFDDVNNINKKVIAIIGNNNKAAQAAVNRNDLKQFINDWVNKESVQKYKIFIGLKSNYSNKSYKDVIPEKAYKYIARQLIGSDNIDEYLIDLHLIGRKKYNIKEPNSSRLYGKSTLKWKCNNFGLYIVSKGNEWSYDEDEIVLIIEKVK